MSRLLGVLAAALPTIAFVAVNATYSLRPALIATGLAAVAIFAWRLARREPLKHAVIGFAIAAVCAGIAAFTGEARGFFLAPTIFPVVALLVCLGSVLSRRPLTGLLLNRLAGGPPRWYDDAPLRRIYAQTTLAAVAVNVINGTLQGFFYMADQPIVLAIIHVATGPVFVGIVAATVFLARREIRRQGRRVGSVSQDKGNTSCGS